MSETGRTVIGAIVAAATGALVLGGCGLANSVQTLEDGSPVHEVINQVRFDVPAGAVRIRVEDEAPVSVRRQVEFQGERRPAASHQVAGDTLVLGGCGPACSVDYDVVLPAPMPIRGMAEAGDIEITGAATAEIKASAGRVSMQEIAGSAQVDADAGDVDLGLAVPASVRAHARAGAVSVTVPPGPYQVNAHANTGDTQVQVPSIPGAPHRLDLRTEAGALRVDAA